ncbi:gamma-glutamyl-gamma-aminobutyrate hydrolase family protein [Nitratireductor indicus]|uniref:Glutamine amidotransferase n=1 Tax=Nitratireductor indicus C115 TaxID=1231190 RepID=K2PSI9_9HYPH|nr:gamma-glutamyl-gamma-aminobutyrate hydrolase family protein [Nitratireductor indicus]EKF44037.1 glutamine amidotransferase [Nitratireductor indicus C115]MDS1135624.1 gamma-glutamyl-gamma-aminobutyrate hydrolase family protein [Nitratireductor indicus]SFQ11597.1 putative glutamine amidotransferase [Nitratireductor indicus]
MAFLPVVGVIACTRPVEGEAAQIVKERYLRAVRQHAEALPVILPSNLQPGDVGGILPRIDAVLLTGSNSNIEPSRYGSPLARRGLADGARDDTSAGLIEAAVKGGKPLFGICRGLQEINVAFGGTIEDERENGQPGISHHAPEDADLEAMFGYGHAAQVVDGGAYAKAIGTSGRIDVNSVHFQRIGKLGQGLSATVKSLDGVVEGVAATGSKAPVFAVQWHPEWRPEERPHDLAFWHYLGRVARGEAG